MVSKQQITSWRGTSVYILLREWQ